MNNAAAIQAQLVDIRNLGTEKCVKLTLHIPAEQAPFVLKAFGWPTAVDPVPVALARLTQPKENEAQPRPSALPSDEATTGGAKQRRPFTSLPLPQQAALLCNDPVFRAFLNEECGFECEDEEDAAVALRYRCDVASRSEILPNTKAAERFIADRDRFTAWKLVSA